VASVTIAPLLPYLALRRGMLISMLRTVAIGFVVFMVVGNVAILFASAVAKWAATDGDSLSGVKNFMVVDDTLWRSGAPTEAGYESLVEAGVATIVDLRAEEGLEVPTEMLAASGVEFRPIPIRDGQTPTEDQVREFLGAVGDSSGPVLVHCGAGVGRTGAMVAAYLAATDQGSGADRVRHNLTAGPPSLEQIAYAARLDGDFDRPNVALVAASRLLDAPRRIFHRIGL